MIWVVMTFLHFARLTVEREERLLAESTHQIATAAMFAFYENLQNLDG
jgi:hypothetical protein